MQIKSCHKGLVPDETAQKNPESDHRHSGKRNEDEFGNLVKIQHQKGNGYNSGGKSKTAAKDPIFKGCFYYIKVLAVYLDIVNIIC
jgi:hypothetical protein